MRSPRRRVVARGRRPRRKRLAEPEVVLVVGSHRRGAALARLAELVADDPYVGRFASTSGEPYPDLPGWTVARFPDRRLNAGANRNVAAARAAEEFPGTVQLLLDDDTHVPWTGVAAAAAWLARRPDWGLLSPSDGRTGSWSDVRLRRLPEFGTLDDTIPYRCVLVAPEAVARVGFQDPGVDFLREDTDYCVRVRASGLAAGSLYVRAAAVRGHDRGVPEGGYGVVSTDRAARRELNLRSAAQLRRLYPWTRSDRGGRFFWKKELAALDPETRAAAAREVRGIEVDPGAWDPP